MKKIFIFINLFTICTLQLLAQANIGGRVINAEGKSLEFVSVSLYNAKDSSLKQGVNTAANGTFQFKKIPQGSYFIAGSLIGYKNAKSEVLKVSTESIATFPNMVLYEEVRSLNAVVVTAKKHFVEQQADKMVINPDAGITTASDDILEVLRKSPGVNIDKDNNITLKNKSVQVTIDGRPTYMSGESLAAMLRNMQATSVDRLELIENPSSKYDAEGDGGIINIRTKKGLLQGYNGTVSAGIIVGRKFSENYGIDLNYRSARWNVYGNYYGGERRKSFDLELDRKFEQTDGALFAQYNELNLKSYSHGLKIGADYYLTPKHVFGLIARGNFRKEMGQGNGDAQIRNAAGTLIEQIRNLTEDENRSKNLLLNANYKWTIDTLGQELSVDADMGYYDTKNIGDLNTSYIPPTVPLIIRNDQQGISDFYALKADYVKLWNKKTRVEAGAKMSFATIDSDLSYLEQEPSGYWSDPAHRSNRFIYKENINAVYLSGNHQFSPNTSLQIGLRGEQTNISGNNLTIQERNTRDYFNLFPTLFFQQKINDKHQFGFSYSYRIGRPPYRMLNPFLRMIDPYTYHKGNPFIDAQFTHAANASYTFKKKYILSANLSYTNDAWTQIFEQDDATRAIIITWVNLDSYYNASLTAVLPIKISKWWITNTNLSFYYNKYDAALKDGHLNEAQYSFRGNTSFTFLLPKDFSLELSGWYQSNSVYGMLHQNPRGSVDAGAQKQFANKKLMLKLAVSDIFNTSINSYWMKQGNANVQGWESGDNRRITLSFSWRFGRNDIKAARQRSTGLDEETRRAN